LGNYLGQRLFTEFIRTEFGPLLLEADDVLYRFISIPFRHLLTFNFDQSMERAHATTGVACGSFSCSSRREIAMFLREMNTPEYKRQIVHLHGKGSDAIERIALTEEGYAALYNDPLFLNFLWLLATSQRLVFIGFGFEDFDFLHEFRVNVRQVCDNGLSHFAIMGLRAEEDDQPRRYELNDSCLIEPVFYTIHMNEDEEDHREFVELVNALATTVGKPIQQVAAPRPAATAGTAPDASDLRRAERLADRILERADPGGRNVQG
jgi:hypothetical protein